MNPPPIPPPYRPPQDNKNKWVRPALLAGLVAVPMAIAMIFGVVHTINSQRKAHAAWQDVKSSANEMHDDLKKNFDPKNGVTNVDMAKFDKMREGLKNVSQNAMGDDAILAQVMSQYLDRLQTAVKNYQDASGKLRAAHVLDKFDSSDTTQIPARREVVQQFLAANTALKQVITNSEDRLRADLTEAKVRDAKIEKFIQGFHSSTTGKNALTLKIRQCDDRIGAAMLDALNTLETEQGHWKADPATDRLRFETTATRDAYNNAIADMKAASQEQLQLQARLVNQPASQQP